MPHAAHFPVHDRVAQRPGTEGAFQRRVLVLPRDRKPVTAPAMSSTTATIRSHLRAVKTSPPRPNRMANTISTIASIMIDSFHVNGDSMCSTHQRGCQTVL